MALVLNDRVKETTTTTGTGTVNLGGAETGFDTFVAGVGNGNTTYYCITAGAEFEVGLGTVTDASPDTLSRTTILSSSNSDSAVDFSAGTKDVFCTLPASKAVFEDASSNVTLPGTLDVDGGITVDNITIDGTEIDLSSGNLTIDVAGDIALDCGGGDINLQDDGTQFGSLENDGTNFIVKSERSDADLLFKVNDGGSSITALTIDSSEAGNASFNGSVTANAGVIVDNITIDGTEIDLSSGDLTLDVAGDIILDADGADVKFSDAGTQIGQIEMASTSFNIRSMVSDADLLFKGNDGGSTITALTLDMSEAGNASFNGTVTANAGVVVDNITIDGTEIDLSSGDLTIDAAGRIDLSADDNGEVRLFDGSSQYGQFKDDSDRLKIQSMISDADMLFVGNDGGSEVTALQLDMSNAGRATFNENIVLGDNGKVEFGAGADMSIYHDGNNSKIEDNGTGDLILDSNSDIILDADGGDITFKDAGTEFAHISNAGTNLQFTSAISDNDVLIVGNDGGSTITALTIDMSEAGAATFNNNVTAFSDERLKDNIETLEDGLAKVEQLRGVTYTRDGKENIGVIAQEVEKILPEIVLTADDEMGTKSVDYSRITAVLIEAVKELSARVKELESK